MPYAMILVLWVLGVTILGILLLAVFNMPVTFAGAVSALGIGVATAIVRFWPPK
jgi:hypothetical protein